MQFLPRATSRPTSTSRKRINRANSLRRRFEPLEDRKLLSANDLLISTYDDTAGMSVLRYDDTWTPVAGGVATNDNGLGVAQGLVVAPDGMSFYVSSDASFPGQVLHYDMAGNFLDVLGANDASPVVIQTPGALAFGPNGNLYVADLGTFGMFPGGLAIYQFDTSSESQQYHASGTYDLGFAPGGLTFAPDGSDDLIVGDLSTQAVRRFQSTTTSTTLIEPGSGINPSTIVARPNGDLLVGDFDFGGEPFDHHRIVLYDESADTFDTFINLTTPVGTGASAGYAPQPTSLAYDENGNLLIGVSPDHNLNGAVLKYDFGTQDLATLISNIGTPTGLGLIPSANSTVAGRFIFYNNSYWDNNNAAIQVTSGANNHDDDNDAIATDKSAYLPGSGASTWANITGYDKGINGIMIDLSTGVDHSGLTLANVAANFIFKVGNNSTPSGWAVAPAPNGLSVIPGGGLGGTDRVEITWGTGVNGIYGKWLEVGVLPTAQTGLADSGQTIDPDGPGVAGAVAVGDVFFFGNAVGGSGDGDTVGAAPTNTADELGPATIPRASATSPWSTSSTTTTRIVKSIRPTSCSAATTAPASARSW